VDNLSLFACSKKGKFAIFAFSKREANLPFLPFLKERQICHF